METILNFINAGTEGLLPLHKLVFIMIMAALLGVVISLTYLGTQRFRSASQTFAVTLVVLPVVVAIIILLVGSNIARAFSLAGAFAIIRFRSAPGDPKDITYVLMCMAVGLACGMDYVLYAMIATAILCVVSFTLHLTNFGRPKSSTRLLKITIPEDMNYHGVFDDILQKHTRDYKMVRVRTVNLGSLYELVYTVQVTDTIDEKAFIDELRTRNGNLNITFVLQPQVDDMMMS